MDVFGFNGQIALWGAPQVFPWSNYNSYEENVWPTETQMRSMSLLMAVMGAKGFVMYSYMDLFRDKSDFNQHWPEICRVAQTLRDLAPYLLGDAPNPTLDMKVVKGQIEAKALRKLRHPKRKDRLKGFIDK
ncbi:MAG: hypothetical protein EOM87_03660 [Clostridia bacterium]|nr:hypothetical protein [Clostridia bacterium]